jgi:hypothetical protein
MKHCHLKDIDCKYCKDKSDYRDLGDRVICALQALTMNKNISVEAYTINHMRKCPLDKETNHANTN